MDYFNDIDLWTNDSLTKDPYYQFTDVTLITNDINEPYNMWMTKPVSQWQNKDVIQWLLNILKEKNLMDQLYLNDFIKSSVFSYLNGNTLLTLSELDFIYLDQNLGSILYQSLQEYITNYNNNNNDYNFYNLQNDFSQTVTTINENLKSNYNTMQDSFDEAYNLNFIQENQLFFDNISPNIQQPLENVVKIDKNDTICHLEKKSPGRPKNLHKITKKKSEKRTGRLWEFIRNLLLNRKYCPSLICWENYDEGVFRFVQSEKVAQLWGSLKANPKMTYEKLSRAMRYYYKSKVLQPVLGRRLVYKFGPSAYGWRTTNPNFLY